jgi:pimeloyl-ACP methyl ester carboxylesterase
MNQKPEFPRLWSKGLSVLLLLSILFVTFPVTAVASEPPLWPEECNVVNISGDDPDFSGEQIILTCLPEPWNGYLVVYAHGYVAPQEDLALPVEELGQGTLPDGQSIIEILMSMGFAFATTSYHKNGWAVEQAEDDIIDLIQYFEDEVAGESVAKILLTGASEGGLVTTMMIEKHPDVFAGGLAMCGPVAGAPYQLDYVGDFRVVFDYFFPRIFDFGATNVPVDAYLDWDTVYAPAIRSAIKNSHAKRFQLMTVTKAPWVPWDASTAVTTAQTLLRYSIVGTNDLIALSGEMPYNNIGRKYAGSWNDWRLNRKVERVEGDPAYLIDYYHTTGKLEIPLVTLHTLLDGAVPFRHEVYYLDRVASKGRSRYLTVLPVTGYGHCAFEPYQVLGAFALLFLQVGVEDIDAIQPYIETLPEPMK